ncbi:hypothetical protein N9Q76_01180 [Flavobacteriales bacterium]|nr:hypothetical protein [Flavobacteriales bacterium]
MFSQRGPYNPLTQFFSIKHEDGSGIATKSLRKKLSVSIDFLFLDSRACSSINSTSIFLKHHLSGSFNPKYHKQGKLSAFVIPLEDLMLIYLTEILVLQIP